MARANGIAARIKLSGADIMDIPDRYACRVGACAIGDPAAGGNQSADSRIAVVYAQAIV
jgi:hypothetical protein